MSGVVPYRTIARENICQTFPAVNCPSRKLLVLSASAVRSILGPQHLGPSRHDLFTNPAIFGNCPCFDKSPNPHFTKCLGIWYDRRRPSRLGRLA